MPSTSGRGPIRGDVVGEYRLGHPLAASFLSFLEAESAADSGIFETAATTHSTPSPASSLCGGEAEVAALVGRERRPGEPIHPPGDLAPGVTGEPPRHGLAGVRVEGADGGRPQVDVHPERGRILWHGSLPNLVAARLRLWHFNIIVAAPTRGHERGSYLLVPSDWVIVSVGAITSAFASLTKSSHWGRSCSTSRLRTSPTTLHQSKSCGEIVLELAYLGPNRNYLTATALGRFW